MWDEIARILMEPQALHEGYEDSLAQQEETVTRQKALLETMRRRALNLEQMRRNLTTAYLDPEIEMTKAEYLEQKNLVDTELSELIADIDKKETELAPTPADLETLEAFAASMRALIPNERRINPEEKRRILEMLHVRVLIDKEGKQLRIEGWFSPPIEGLLSNS